MRNKTQVPWPDHKTNIFVTHVTEGDQQDLLSWVKLSIPSNPARWHHYSGSLARPETAREMATQNGSWIIHSVIMQRLLLKGCRWGSCCSLCINPEYNIGQTARGQHSHSITHLQNTKQLRILLRPVEVFLLSPQQWQRAANETRATYRAATPSPLHREPQALGKNMGLLVSHWTGILDCHVAGEQRNRSGQLVHMPGCIGGKGGTEMLAKKNKHLPLGSCLCT